jgi:hypothetical protein
MPTVQELRERAKREQEAKRRREQGSSSPSTPFATDGFFESTQYYNTPDSGCGGNDSGSSSSDSGSCSFDS